MSGGVGIGGWALGLAGGLDSGTASGRWPVSGFKGRSRGMGRGGGRALRIYRHYPTPPVTTRLTTGRGFFGGQTFKVLRDLTPPTPPGEVSVLVLLAVSACGIDCIFLFAEKLPETACMGNRSFETCLQHFETIKVLHETPCKVSQKRKPLQTNDLHSWHGNCYSIWQTHQAL